MATDWLNDGPPPRPQPLPDRTPTPPPARDKGNVAGLALPGPVIVALELLLLTAGLATVVLLPEAQAWVGYLACGVLLPVLWAGYHVQQKKLYHEGLPLDASLWQRANLILLVAGLFLGLYCTWIAATAWAK